MNITLVNNKYLNAFLLLMLISAAIHLVVITTITLTTGDASFFNFFSILEIDYFFPVLVDASWSSFASVGVVVLLYLAIIKTQSHGSTP